MLRPRKACARVSGIADPLNGRIDESGISHVQLSTLNRDHLEQHEQPRCVRRGRGRVAGALRAATDCRRWCGRLPDRMRANTGGIVLIAASPRLDPRHGAALAHQSLGFPRPWNEVPALMGSAPPARPPSTATGVVTFLMGLLTGTGARPVMFRSMVVCYRVAL
jgi:hypothetical protein